MKKKKKRFRITGEMIAPLLAVYRCTPAGEDGGGQVKLAHSGHALGRARARTHTTAHVHVHTQTPSALQSTSFHFRRVCSLQCALSVLFAAGELARARVCVRVNRRGSAHAPARDSRLYTQVYYIQYVRVCTCIEDVGELGLFRRMRARRRRR